MNAALVVWTIISGRDTQTLLRVAGKKMFELYALLGSGNTKTLQFSLAR